MPYYKNIGLCPISYYGITVQPGHVTKFPGNVMNLNLVRVKDCEKEALTDSSNDADNTKHVRRIKKREQLVQVAVESDSDSQSNEQELNENKVTADVSKDINNE